MNKYHYLLIVQGNYGHGWEDLSEYLNTDGGRKVARHDLAEYEIAAPEFSHRIIKRRELQVQA